MKSLKKVLVTGGAGYVGSVLVPQLLRLGYHVKVLDLYIYGEDVLDEVKDHPNLEQIRGDIRDIKMLEKSIIGCDAVIHLACISNDPSVQLDPELSKTINYDAFIPLVRISKENGIKRFIFASSGSVYGISNTPNVTENHPLVPVSLYNKFKAKCEPILLDAQSPDFTTVIVRPATICGSSPRQRLDLMVNILTNTAVNSDCITVYGGKQMRPNIHIKDIVDLYTMLLKVHSDLIAGQIFNAGCRNYSVSETAEIVRHVVGDVILEKAGVDIVKIPNPDDIRSYRISSEKIERVLGFVPKRTIKDGIRDLVGAFQSGKLTDPLNNILYHNIKMMKHIRLK